MAQRGTVGDLLIRLSTDVAGLKAQLSQVERNFSSTFGRVESQAKRVASNLAGIFAGALSFGAAFSFFRSSLAELEKQEQAKASLEATLKSTGQASQQ
jgi:hypothetical protein